MKTKVIFSVLLLVFAVVTVLEALQLPRGTLKTPQAGLWPFTLALILVLLSGIHLGKALKSERGGGVSFFAQNGRRNRVGLVVVTLFAFGFFFDRLGYLISVSLLVGILLRMIEPMRWWLVITIAVLSSALSYFLFGVLLETPLPAGLLTV